jgi:lysophospholipase L1-like esterase
MVGEPVLFVQDEGQTAAAGRLAFVPLAMPTVQSPDGQTVFVAGRDFAWQQGSNRITLLPGSRIPSKTAAEMVPPPGTPNTLFGLLFAEGHFFHDLQMQVSYQHEVEWPLPPLEPWPGLHRTRGILAAKAPLRIVALGDSITEGYNASGFAKSAAPPHQPAYPQQVADSLQARFGGPVSMVNLGLAGTAASWGLEMVAKVREANPDLVLLAFGMNHNEPAAEFAVVMQKLRDAVMTACPDADVVLVAPMTGNPRAFPTERFIGYRDALRGLTSDRVALADVTTPWLELLRRKSFADLSGNHINHPNDFGHRLYAEVVCALL